MVTKKVVLFTLFAICYASIVFAGPFGLEMGMTLKEIGGVAESLGNGKYKLSNVPKPHSAFEDYIVQVSPNGGLCWIKAVGKDISTSCYGTELKSEFMDLVNKLEKAYGNYKLYDFLLPGSIWDELKDWMSGLIKKERTLAASWSEEDNSTLSNNIKDIVIAAQPLSREKGYITIDYTFINKDACEKEINAAEDGNL